MGASEAGRIPYAREAMPRGPWWISRVDVLSAPVELGLLGLGGLWRLSESLQFVRDNVDAALLPADFLGTPSAEPAWSAFLRRELDVRRALREAGARVVKQIQRGELGPRDFRVTWETLGFLPHAEDAGTAADDYLDGLFQMTRLTLGEEMPVDGSPNMASRAERVADFLKVTEPSAADVVMDLGSGNGKFALTVSSSSLTRVVGVELGGSYVAAARRTAHGLALQNVHFIHADVRDVDLSPGSIFYLYHPFRGVVAKTVSEMLGRLARRKDITVYLAGPGVGYAEHFLHEVETGALSLRERRGEFSDVLVLGSATA